jgi:sugar phosphate isomerase/epimerase
MNRTGTTLPHSIKRGVTFYSWRHEYFIGKMTLEDCIRTAAELGIPGIEVIGEQMVPNFPDPGDEWLAQWKGWLAKYDRTPVAHDMFLDVNRYKGRLMTEDEQVESVVRDIKFANLLGCTVIRMIHVTPPEIMKGAASYAEKYNVKLALEVHAPHQLDDVWMQKHLAVMREVGSPYLGYTVDMGIFTKHTPRIFLSYWLANGMRPHIADFITERYNSHEATGQIPKDVERMGGTQDEITMSNRAARFIFADPQRLAEYMPHILHVHGKFNDMIEDPVTGYREEAIPYDEVVPVLIEGGYNGYISSEYEGNGWLVDDSEADSVEQVRRHQVMLRRLLGEAQADETGSRAGTTSPALLGSEAER